MSPHDRPAEKSGPNRETFRAGSALEGVCNDGAVNDLAGDELMERHPVSWRELSVLVRELRRIDRLPAEDREAVLARKRAMVERLEPGWYDELRDEGVADDEIELDTTDLLESFADGTYEHPDIERPSPVSRRDLLVLVRELRRVDRLPAEDRDAVMARKRAMVERLEPGWYDELRAEGVTDEKIERDTTDHLVWLASGDMDHPDVEQRPSDPKSPAWAAMVDQSQTRHAAAVEALAELELDCAATGGSFPDTLRSVLEDLARRLGGSEDLVETRPGCWEADHIRALAAGADWITDGSRS